VPELPPTSGTRFSKRHREQICAVMPGQHARAPHCRHRCGADHWDDAGDCACCFGGFGDVLGVFSGNCLSQQACGVRVNVVKDVLKAGADILVVGRAITASKDIKRAADELIEHMDKEKIDQFRVMTDF